MTHSIRRPDSLQSPVTLLCLILFFGGAVLPCSTFALVTHQQQQEPVTVGVIDLDVNNVDEGEASPRTPLLWSTFLREATIGVSSTFIDEAIGKGN